MRRPATRALLSLGAVLALTSLEACAVAPPPGPPRPPTSTRSWDVDFPREDDAFELRVGTLRLKFTRLQPVRPIGGLEPGESNLGFGVDLLGLGASFGDDASRAAPKERVEQEDAQPRAFRELDRDLERSIERVHEAAKRAQEQEDGPAP